jgi:ferric-dicitrate binding protein FerR (iron transport regulator)
MNGRDEGAVRAREWMLRYIDGTLPDDGVRQLNRHLKADAEARAEFAEILLQCVQLSKLGRGAALEASSDAPGKRVSGRRWGIAAAAAGVLAGVFLAWAAVSDRTPYGGGPGAAPSVATGAVSKAGLPDAEGPSERVPPSPATGDERPAEAEGKEAEAGRLSEAHGDVFLRSPSGVQPAAAGARLRAGQGLETGPAGSAALLTLPDATQVRLGPGARILEVSDRRLVVDRGAFAAEVPRAAAGRPFVVSTPQGDVKVRIEGELLLDVGRDATRLEVVRGEAELVRHPDGKSARVAFGCFATASPGAAPVATWKGPGGEAARRLSLKGAVTINFGPAAIGLPEGVLNDAGEEFDPRQGYGWKGPRAGRELPGAFLTRPDGTRVPVRGGREPWLSEMRAAGLGVLRASSVAAGWKDHTETWRFPLPNGRYLVSVCCGDADRPQGPHHVAVEGVQAVDALVTKAGEFVGVLDLPVEVRDGELTLVVGGSGKALPEGDSDTALNYVVVKRAPE